MTDDTPDQPADGTTPEPTAPEAKPAHRGLFRKRSAEPSAEPSGESADQPAAAAPDTSSPDAADADGADAGDRTRPGVLRRRRRQLLGKYEQGIFDLGGLALELHRRGLLAEEVMRRKAAEVADLRGQVDQVDERLEEIRAERGERRKSGKGATMTCPSCGARCKANANFCAECGASLKPPDAPAGVSTGDDQPTSVITDASTQDTQVISGDDAGRTEVLPPVKVDE